MQYPRQWMLRNAALILLLALGSAALRAAVDDSAVGQVNEAKARLQLTHILQPDKDTLAQTIGELMGRANELDQLRSQVIAKTQEANDAKAAYQSAADMASRLRQQASETSENAKSRENAIFQQASRICGGLGGSFDGSTCRISCKEEECGQKHSSWESQVAPLKSELSELGRNEQESEQSAAAAEADQSAKQAALEQAQSTLSPLVEQLQQKLPPFQHDLASLNHLLEQAEKSPLTFHVGPAYRQAETVLKEMSARRLSCFDDRCFDVGANSDGTLAPPPAPPAAAIASMPKYDQLQSELQNLTSQYNDTRQKLQAAIATKDPAVGTLVNQLSSLNNKLEFGAYQLNSLKATHGYSGPSMAQGPAN